MMSDQLKSPQQEKFAQYLAQGQQKAEAYRMAYPKSVMWEAKTVWEHASRLANNSKVKARVAALQAPAMKAMEISIERILKENAALAFSDVRRLFREDGTMKPIAEWDDDLAAAVASIEVQEIGGGDDPVTIVRKIKFWDKGAALEKLFKNFGMYAKDNEQKLVSIEKMLNEIAEIGRHGILGGRRGLVAVDD